MKSWSALLLAALSCVSGLTACDTDGDADADGDLDADAEDDAESDADQDGVLHVEDQPGCNPLIPEVCAFPFPSMAHLVEDGSSPTGYRAALSQASLPPDTESPEVFLERFNDADGFSIATPWLALFPEAPIDATTLPSLSDLAESTTASSSVQVVDRETGRRFPVWVERDRYAESAEEQTLIIRPMEGLPFGRRVAVVITDALRTEGGDPPVAPEAFAALRDGVPTDNETIEGWRSDYEELFTFLEGLGVPRQSTLLAWEAVTFTRETATSPVRPMLEQALELVEASPPTYTLTRCLTNSEEENARFGCLAQENDETPLSPRTWRRLYGRVDLPLFLDEARTLRTDDAGHPVAEGTMAAEFVVNVPVSLQDAPAGSAPIVIFGHGLLVNPQTYLADDLDANGQMELAERLGAVFLGTRWLGLSNTELIDATNVIYDFGNSFSFSDTIAQGIINQLMMPPFATSSLLEEPLLEAADGSGSLLDVDHLFYTGISQGGIFGTTFMALSPHVRTGVLHVPGGGYVHMIAHSVDFILFQTFLDGAFSDFRDQQVFFALIQRLFDVGDPINFVGHLATDPLTPLGPKSCLWQCAIGDSQAMWYGCDLLMRTAAVPLAGPPTTPVFGLEVLDTPTAPATSAMQQFDPGLGLPPLDGQPLETGAHTAIRRNPEVQLQTVDYFDLDEPGRVVNHCGGPCAIEPVPVPQ